MTENSQQPSPGVTAYLTVNNAADAIEWYSEIFGATENYRINGPDGRVAHLEMEIAGGRMMLADDFPEMSNQNSSLPEALGGTPISLMMYVDNVDEVFDRALDMGGTQQQAPEDTFWGARSGRLTDPYGHRWSIATHQREMTPEEIQAAAKEAFG